MKLGLIVMKTLVNAVPMFIAGTSAQLVKNTLLYNSNINELSRPRRWMLKLAVYGIGTAVYSAVLKASKDAIFVRSGQGAASSLLESITPEDPSEKKAPMSLGQAIQASVVREYFVAGSDRYILNKSGFETREALVEAIAGLDAPNTNVTVNDLRKALQLPYLHEQNGVDLGNEYGWESMDDITIEQHALTGKYYATFPMPKKFEVSS